MKKTLLSLALLALSATGYALDDNRIATMDLTASQLAYYMAPGWNLGNTLEGGNSNNNDTNYGGLAAETCWQNNKTTQEIINFVKSQGFKSIRIPCAWVMGHISDAATTTIDAKWMARVKEVVDYTINADLYVILNDHWDGGWLEDSFNDVSEATVAAKSAKLEKVWTQIATAFKDYDERLLFAGLNEPAHSNYNTTASAYIKALKTYEQVFVNTVRATGGNNVKRVLIVQGPGTNIDDTYNTFGEMPSDNVEGRLMLEVHSYDPWNFCGLEQDESWGKMRYYWGTDKSVSGSGRNASDDGNNEKSLSAYYKKMKQFTDKGIPVVLGEYGANHRNVKNMSGQSQSMHDASVAFWYEKATQYAMECGMIPFAWDTGYTGYPSMAVIDRAQLKVLPWTLTDSSNTTNGALDAIKKGAEAAREAYNKYYSPGVTGVTYVQGVQDNKADALVYNLSGVAVGKSSALSHASKGVYVCNDRKFLVK